MTTIDPALNDMDTAQGALIADSQQFTNLAENVITRETIPELLHRLDRLKRHVETMAKKIG